jgi:hypothetical protein
MDYAGRSTDYNRYIGETCAMFSFFICQCLKKRERIVKVFNARLFEFSRLFNRKVKNGIWAHYLTDILETFFNVFRP